MANRASQDKTGRRIAKNAEKTVAPSRYSNALKVRGLSTSDDIIDVTTNALEDLANGRIDHKEARALFGGLSVILNVVKLTYKYGDVRKMPPAKRLSLVS